MNFENPYDAPALAYAIETAAIQQHAGRGVSVSGGMGIDSAVIELPEGEALQRFIRNQIDARRNPPKVWRGLDVRHIVGAGEQVTFLDVAAALDAAMRRSRLTQQQLDFLTLRDVKGATVDTALVGDTIPSLFEYDPERIKLIGAFRNQLVAEAAPYTHRVAAGAYFLNRMPLPALDSEIIYDTLRLLITPQGIYCTPVFERQYAPFFWSPDGINTSQVYVHPRAVFAIEAFMAGIWRDACVVRERWSHPRGDRRARINTTAQPPKAQNVLVLPRTIQMAQWGSSEDREIVHRAAAQAHTVRGFYRALADGRQAHEADERAAEYGYPAPPEGYTFVRPHTRGEGEVRQDVRRVVCKGLQTINILFN